MPFADKILRDASNDPLVPTPVSSQILQEMPTQSVLLQRARQVRLSSNTQRQPVLDVLPTAFWVSGSDPDTGLKETTRMDWKNVNLIVEELAAIVPIPEAYLDDAQVPIWNEVRPRLVEALGAKLDAAGLFGTGAPSTWPNSIVEAAVATGNTVEEGTGASIVPGAGSATDFAVDVAALGSMLSGQGFSVNGFASRPGLNWRLIGMRNTDGTPIYQPNLQGTPGGMLYGYGLSEVNNGSWVNASAELIAGDWSKAIIGLRQDITFKMFTEGVISDGDGAVVLNLMQSDSVALRVVLRVAYATANPVTALQATEANRFPFAVITPAEGS